MSLKITHSNFYKGYWLEHDDRNKHGYRINARNRKIAIDIFNNHLAYYDKHETGNSYGIWQLVYYSKGIRKVIKEREKHR